MEDQSGAACNARKKAKPFWSPGLMASGHRLEWDHFDLCRAEVEEQFKIEKSEVCGILKDQGYSDNIIDRAVNIVEKTTPMIENKKKEKKKQYKR